MRSDWDYPVFALYSPIRDFLCLRDNMADLVLK